MMSRFVFSSISIEPSAMELTLRLLGIINAGLWFGAGLFLTAVVGPGFFSVAVIDLVGRQNAGLIAQIILAKYFILQTVCVAIALILLSARVQRWRCRHLGLLTFLAAILLLGGFWIQPRLIALNQTRYTLSLSQEKRDAASRDFGRWHGVSQIGNLVVLLGSLVHFAVLANTRSGSPNPRVNTP